MFRIWTAAAAVVLAGLGGVLWYMNGSDCDVRLDKNAGVPIGGPLALVDETGRAVTDADMLRKPTLVYFGYTFCPDVCPLDAARNGEVLTLLQDRGYDIQAAFITIDPERDTPEVLAEFTGYMHDDMTGYTGSLEQIKAASRAFKTYFAKAPGAEDEYYLMDHTTLTYLMLPGIGFTEFFRRDEAAETMAEKVACYLDAAA